MRHPKPARQIDHPGLAGLGDQLGNEFDIILRDLVRMFFTRPARMPMRERGAALADFGGLGGWRHDASKTKGVSVDNWKMNL